MAKFFRLIVLVFQTIFGILCEQPSKDSLESFGSNWFLTLYTLIYLIHIANNRTNDVLNKAGKWVGQGIEENSDNIGMTRTIIKRIHHA